MASTITVTPAEIKNKASELKQFNASLKTQIGELKAHENSLTSKWEGDAKTAFHSAFTRDVVQMDNFYNAIERYAAALLEIAARYEAAENQNTNIASTRKY